LGWSSRPSQQLRPLRHEGSGSSPFCPLNASSSATHATAHDGSLWVDSFTTSAFTGHGSETRAHFPDFIEKSETKAIGRALAALGYGTQHAADLDEGMRVADAPVTRLSGNGYRPSETSAAMGDGTISPKQLAFARQLVAKLGIDDATLAASLQREYGVADLADVGRADASGLIDRLKAKADALAAGGR